MARRRTLQRSESIHNEKLYELLIGTGVGVAFIGIITTCYLAMAEASTAPFEAWIAGQTFF